MLIISKWVNIYLHSVTFPSSFYNHGHSKLLHLQLLMHTTLSVGLASFVFHTRISVISVQHSNITKNLWTTFANSCAGFWYIISTPIQYRIGSILSWNFYNFKQPYLRSCLPVSRQVQSASPVKPVRVLSWKMLTKQQQQHCSEKLCFFCIPTRQKLRISVVDYSASSEASGPPTGVIKMTVDMEHGLLVLLLGQIKRTNLLETV